MIDSLINMNIQIISVEYKMKTEVYAGEFVYTNKLSFSQNKLLNCIYVVFFATFCNFSQNSFKNVFPVAI